MASEVASPEVVSVDMPTAVSKSLRSPRQKPTPVGEASKTKKDKQKVTHLVRESPKKHQKKEKPTVQGKGKVVNLESDEGAKEAGMGTEEIDIEGVDLISKLPKYIPPCRGKVNIPKDPNKGNCILNTPLLPQKIAFEGPRLVRIPT